jgi:hypothetical protein
MVHFTVVNSLIINLMVKALGLLTLVITYQELTSKLKYLMRILMILLRSLNWIGSRIQVLLNLPGW